ncbi:cation:H+ antiporter [Virgibacillus natechei]|uniref:Cation:H+ antiporter n=1 Tax=Virgibacillus natechei TaxID=1216297 RepID=A0ABS4IIB8_9BACI|nr:sodium:calcium antiporter [Virgibacillus natechei]MBP1970705.1 cation:H+ antiporter [Virgibacillus natechei]UZD12051.1 sodium:calcium antiporter [Virgibacillus natechei]
MVFIFFVLAAIATVYTAMKLSQFANVISKKTAMGGMLVGTVLLAGATSLPEVTTSFSAVIIGNVDIAIGNMLGSNLFNLFIIASFDLYFRKKQLYHLVNRNHIYSAILGLFLMVMVTLALFLRIDYTIIGIGVDSIVILLVYIIGMIIISRMPSPPGNNEKEKDKPDEDSAVNRSTTVKKAITGFVIAAVAIMIAGSVLSITGDKIAVITGLGSSFVGSFLIAATTSLPEAVSVFTAFRLKNANMAVGSILGSNMFNMVIIAISDSVYQGGSILADVSVNNRVTAIGISILSIVLIWSLMRNRSMSQSSYLIPSLITIAGYVVVSYLLFMG